MLLVFAVFSSRLAPQVLKHFQQDYIDSNFGPGQVATVPAGCFSRAADASRCEIGIFKLNQTLRPAVLVFAT